MKRLIMRRPPEVLEGPGSGEAGTALAAAERPAPVSDAKAFRKALGAEIKKVEADVTALDGRRSQAERSLRDAVAARNAEVAQLTKELDAARKGTKLRSLGMIPGLRVVLFQDRVETPEGTFPLTPDVHARAEQEGMTQSVQGWVFKSDQDRREIYLHINGPGWHALMTYNMKHSFKQPRDIMEMAYAVGEAASRSPQARAEVAARTAEATDNLVARLRQSLDLDAILAPLGSLEDSVRELIQQLAENDRSASQLAEEERHKDRLVRELASIRSRLEQLSQARSGLTERIRAAEATWRDFAPEIESRRHETAAPESSEDAMPNLADPATTLVVEASPRQEASAVNADEIFAQIERLGELRAKGLITEEEFSEKKGDLLARL